MRRGASSIACVGLLALALPVAAQERTGSIERITSDVASRDFARAVDIVILSEGYPADEEARFRADAATLVKQVRLDPDAAPLRARREINLHVVFVNAKDRGAPWQQGRAARDTPFGAWIDQGGSFVADEAKADGVAARLAPDVDCVVILTRFTPEDDATYTAIAGAPAATRKVTSPRDVRANADVPMFGCRVRIPAHDTQAFLHELGHAMFGLGDEYEEHEREVAVAERWLITRFPNLTLDPRSGRWAHVITSPPIEGGGCFSKGVWRPQAKCRMRESREEAFCAVCAAIMQGQAPAAPVAPVLRAPAPSARVTLTDGRLRLEVAWSHEDEVVSRRPTHFVVEVRDAGANTSPVREELESHLRSFAVDLPRTTEGELLVVLTAVNTAGVSGTAAAPVVLVLPRPARPPTLGLAERLRGLGARRGETLGP